MLLGKGRALWWNGRMNWWEKSLDELNDEQWEALCDGCGLCCMHKFEDEDTGEVLYTDVACRLFDVATCHCTDYANRSVQVPECLRIRQFEPEEFAWLPSSCAYRLRFEDRPLFDWHPLVSGDRDSVHRAAISMQGRCVSETEVDAEDMTLHIVEPNGD